MTRIAFPLLTLGLSLALVLCWVPPVYAEEARLPLSDPAIVREVEFTHPGSTRWIRGGTEFKSIVAFFIDRNSGWKPETRTHYPQFTVSLDVGKKKPLVIWAGFVGETAYLQTAEFGEGKQIREITISDLHQLLELTGSDPSMCLLRPENGYGKRVIDRVLAQETKVSSRQLDKPGVRKLLECVFDYARNNPQDSKTYGVLTELYSLAVADFSQDWYAIRLGAYWRTPATLLANKDGKAMYATPENCLRVCRTEYLGKVRDIAAVKVLCTKILAASDHGVIVSQSQDIPGYEKKPLPADQAILIKPMLRYRRDGRTVYTFSAYQRLGGIIWQCKLTVEDKDLSLSWEMQKVAKDVGDANYIL